MPEKQKLGTDSKEMRLPYFCCEKAIEKGILSSQPYNAEAKM